MEIFDDSAWQMSWGERAALDGILSQLRPGLAIEIGGADGRATQQIARYAGEVHAFDLAPPPAATVQAENVTFHPGDPHTTLPAMLAGLAADGGNVDFALVDADQSPSTVRRTVEELLDSAALRRTLILIHGSTNDRVRVELDAIHFAAWPKVGLVELDLVAGYLVREERIRHELWGGLGLVTVDAARPRYSRGSVTDARRYPAAELLAIAREMVIARERGRSISALAKVAGAGDAQTRMIADLRAELADATEEIGRLKSVSRHHEALWNSLVNSWSWRATEPVRAAKDRLRGKLTPR
ncbi:MAG TPA: class I SAM-dependent methyltransferase [Solirubrobacteraceae bacterium]|nr:class I SAM-dependent methyltransferase [Solirubrobacteraceae bacterium]